MEYQTSFPFQPMIPGIDAGDQPFIPTTRLF